MNDDTAPRVFLSYAREDRDRVELLYERIRQEGYLPWMDVKDAQPGSPWEDEIRRALGIADFYILFLSRNAVTKTGMLQRELRFGLAVLQERRGRDAHIIVARLEECDLPLSLDQISPVDLYESGGWQLLLFALDLTTSRTYDLSTMFRKAEPEITSPERYVFVAMPFSQEFEDIYHYGIQRAVDASGYSCERIDQTTFIGDVLGKIKERILASSVVVADLSGANPNVYLELGFAWGAKIPTILIAQNVSDLHFDVRGQRCLEYANIRTLEERLTAELANLKSQKRI